ncbi:hypothetical protein AHAS_Ahas09G0136800 [Arachis hypogaea]
MEIVEEAIGLIGQWRANDFGHLLEGARGPIGGVCRVSVGRRSSILVFPNTVREAKKLELMQLKQGSMTMAEYANKFD